MYLCGTDLVDMSSLYLDLTDDVVVRPPPHPLLFVIPYDLPVLPCVSPFISYTGLLYAMLQAPRTTLNPGGTGPRSGPHDIQGSLQK